MMDLIEHIKLFIKGIFIGIGGVAPGLSGAVIMISLGIYSRTVDAIATIRKNTKEKLMFLAPLVSGMLLSTVFFSRVIETSLRLFEIQTRLAFFGMLIGTVPLFFNEVRRMEKLKIKHYLVMLPPFIFGLFLVFLGNTANSSETISLPVAFMLGFFGVALTIIPGLNWATFFSAFGIYGHWLTLMSLRPEDFSFSIYSAAFVGAVIGLVTISKAISFLFRRAYTVTMSALFGFFVAIIPSIIFDSSESLENLSFGAPLVIGLILFIVGIIIAFWVGRLSKAKERDSDN